MTTRRTILLRGGILLVTAAAAAEPAGAQMEEVLTQGSAWTLRVNAEEGPLVLVEGRGGRTAEGGFELAYRVTWSERPGTLRGESDSAGAMQRVTLELTDGAGAVLLCRGLLARGGSGLMAGTCGDRRAPDVWYARRAATAASPQAAITARNARRERLAAAAAAAVRDGAAPPDDQAGGVTPAPMGTFLHRLTGRYPAGGGGKEDSAQPLEFPSPQPGNAALNNWLTAHNRALLGALEGLYSGDDVSAFRAAEGTRCQQGGVFCQIAFRQQAIAFALQGER